jgi:hypothetical protein
MEALKSISPYAEQLINEYGLGHIKGEYSEKSLQAGLKSAALLPIGLVLLVLAVITLLPITLSDWSWWQLVGKLFSLLLGGSFLSLIGIFGVIVLIITLWKGEKRLYLGEKGFILLRRRIEAVTRWEAVTEVHRHILFVKGKSKNVWQVKSVCKYTVIPAEGKKCSFADELGSTIEEAVTANQLPHMLENHANGQTLSFGWLALDNSGLHLRPEVVSAGNPTALRNFPGISRTSQKLQGTCTESGERFLPWEQLSCYWIDESKSTFILSRRGERKHWAILPLYQITNPAISLALIEHICDGVTHKSA